jgi:hypothetical protein
MNVQRQMNHKKLFNFRNLTIGNFSPFRIFCFLLMVAFLQCSQVAKERPGDLQGLWCFLDGYGNYNEAYFDATRYKTLNRFIQAPLLFNYMVQNDTLFSDADRRKSGMKPIAIIHWLDRDRVVFKGEFVSDTLYRLPDVSIHPGNSDPVKDSLMFWPAFYNRYESFLIERGIITAEDALQFRESGKIPDEVLEELTR